MNTTHPARAVLMVRPTTFGFDKQTAESNAFQNMPTISDAEIRQKAGEEFRRAVDMLSNNGIEVVVFEDNTTPPKPNAVFPNNWFSTWPDGRIYLYPMATESRRIERSEAAIAALKKHFEVSDVIDITASENDGRFLESTGVMIFDHKNKIAYGCVSIRCDAELFTTHARALGYTPAVFHAYDENGIAIYHTNVLMGVQTSTAVVCLDAISDMAERKNFVHSLETTGHTIVDISYAQMEAFCGNVLELENPRGEKFLAMSQTAYDNFTPDQRHILARDKTLLPLAIPTIESIGGGSVRCMLGEIFLTQMFLTPILPAHETMEASTVS
jgi:hypothetical protein